MAYVLLTADGAKLLATNAGACTCICQLWLTTSQHKYCVYLGAGIPSWPNVEPDWGALGLISPAQGRLLYQFNEGGLELESSVGRGAPRLDRRGPSPVTQYVRGSLFARITRVRRDASLRYCRKVLEITQDLHSAPCPFSESKRDAGIEVWWECNRQGLPTI